MNYKTISKSLLIVLFTCILSACVGGDDYTPVYFPPQEEAAPKAPAPDISAGGRQCTLSFTSQLCVAIKGDNIAVGSEEGDELCAEVPAFPIHVSGTKVTIKGSEFPDIEAEGHGLPAPITINGRGDGDGASNVGEGTIDASGNMTINNFSLFIVALGIVGEVPHLTLTTASTEEMPALPQLTGSPPDAAGAMTLVTGTVLGHIIDAADQYLKGASLTASLRGQLTPPISQCGGEGKSEIEVKKITPSEDGKEDESPIDENIMDVSEGTFIADGPLDVGDRFETTARFRVTNIGQKPLGLAIPSRAGPFHMRSISPLTRTISPKESFVLEVKFRPTTTDKAGRITQTISIGPDQFTLAGVALAKSSKGQVGLVGEDGSVSELSKGKATVAVGTQVVSANAERAFFRCRAVKCGTTSKAWTACSECKDPSTEPCELLPISTKKRPMGETDDKCHALDPEAAPLFTIDLKGTTETKISGQRQVLAIRNKGVSDMKVTSVSIVDESGSKSKGEFSIPPDSIFVAKSFADIQGDVTATLDGKKTQGRAARLPVVLPPYMPGYDERTMYVVITYRPSDLLGSDGREAIAGGDVEDKATLRIKTNAGEIVTKVSGKTAVHKVPALELYFKTSVGIRRVEDSGVFQLRGVGADTIALAVPLFLRVADAFEHTIRVTSISIAGGDSGNFAWLDTQEKISAQVPPSGKGIRCSIPTIDETTGEMISENFNLKPVPLKPSGFDISPGAYTTNTMPFFGCVNFHREDGATKRLYEATLTVTSEELDPKGAPVRSPDGGNLQATLNAQLLAAVNPKSGKLVMRITQTMSGIMNPQTPFLSSVYSKGDAAFVHGMKGADLQIFTSAFILDPFDEMTIKTSDGKEVVSIPGDGITAVFRAIDTHPVSEDYSNEALFDYASLLFDSARPAGTRGIFEDYPNLPQDAKANGWRIFTGSLSWPGPLVPRERAAEAPSSCKVINPCSREDMKLFTDEGVGSTGKGACAFFYASGARIDSPSFGDEYDKLCKNVDKPQELIDLNTGVYSVDGKIIVGNIRLRFFGPTYFHNPNGPLGPKPPLDELFDVGFTTGVLKPPSGPREINVLPDQRIDLSKGEFKINLNDKKSAIPPLCEKNTKNRLIQGRAYSTWKFLDGMLFKDEDGTIPTGCPDDGNKYTGGVAYLKGRDLDQETGTVTFVSASKFGSSDDLTFAFKDVMTFVVLNGWMCDPMGREEDFEGKRCYDTEFNERDAIGQVSIVR